MEGEGRRRHRALRFPSNMRYSLLHKIQIYANEIDFFPKLILKYSVSSFIRCTYFATFRVGLKYAFANKYYCSGNSNGVHRQRRECSHEGI